ncbi:MAG TPA: ATP-binding protein [Thermoanaerobaculia bacterium]|nr:ATP-binding protein [Thermoanaerobaculia bacterium]
MLRSLRSRLIFGTILGASGALAIAHLLSIALMHRYPLVLRIHHETLIVFAVILIVAGLLQVRRGLSPIDQLRTRLSAVHEGRERRIGGDYPSEVQPLVNDLNALLEHRERIVARAIAKAGDLAHGLKTPLAVLAQEGERAAEAGQPDLAAAIGQQVDRMRRQIDYHLAQARAAASGAAPGTRSSVAASVDGLTRTLLRLYAERGLSIEASIAAGHFVRCEREDLDEMLGNILDNACKWAGSRVTVASSASDAGIVIAVDDDGPGLDPSMREAVLQRGVRADEAAPGSGLGLAIVRDLAELYGGSILLETSAAGGLRARLQLPKG